MKTLDDFLIDLKEALGKIRVVQKASDKPQHDPRMTDPKEPQEDERYIGNVGGYRIIKSEHTKHTRDYQKFSRDYGMTKNDFLDVIDKFIKKTTPKDGKKYHLFYKKTGRYNDLIVAVDGKTITIITVIQLQKQSVLQYFSKPGELRLTLESVVVDEEIYILLDLVI
jgi:hypothetical protein